jgi:hypothetical protein
MIGQFSQMTLIGSGVTLSENGFELGSAAIPHWLKAV